MFRTDGNRSGRRNGNGGRVLRRWFRVAIGISAVGLLTAATWSSTADSPVADAAMKGDTARVRQLIKQGADVNAAQGDGMTALHWAAMTGFAGEAQMLIAAGAQLEAATRNGKYTPLHLAAREGKAAVVRVLAAAGANIGAPTTSGGAAALHFATQFGSVEAMSALLDAGAKVDVRDSALLQTPLMWAAAFNRVDAIKLLIKRGADIKAVSKIEDIPARDRLERAALQQRNRRVTAMRTAEAPPATGRGGPPVEAFPAATVASLGFSNVVGDTTATGGARGGAATAGRGGRAGGAPGDTAAGGGRGRGGQTYGDLVGNKGGLSPLLFAIRQGNTDAALALLAAGAEVNQLSGDKTSPLLMATINGHFDLAKLLLLRGANPKLASDANATPLYSTINIQWGAKSLYPQPTAQTRQQTTYLDLMEALLKAGADPNVRLTKHLWYMSFNFDLLGVNTAGAAPFWRAAYATDVPAMKLLKKYGADHTIPTLKPNGLQLNADAPTDDAAGGAGGDPSGLPPVPNGGAGVGPLQAATGVGYGEGFAANSHMHAPDSWLAAAKYLIEELGVDPNSRDHNGYNALHHAAARGDNELMIYLVAKGVDIKAVSRKGETVADMANGPVSRIVPFPETVALAEKLGSKNNHKCKSC
ncbi:hypothetical protein LBMAG44_12600 [Gemmatimonadota bacterium]|nr:hypothetical protein LBMAG44_12600 [Gemmatimonadota bacterium]